MANLRIVYNNVANSSTISAATTAGSLAATNLLTDIKSEVYRSTSTTATITMTWTSPQTASCVAFPFASLTNAATIRVRCYTFANDPSPIFDTGTKNACAGYTGTVGGVNRYAYGGSAYASTWFASQSFKQLTIDIVDSANPLGYIEAGRIVVGDYFSPANNASYTAPLTGVDNTKNERTDAGDLRSDRGTMHKTLTFSMEYMTATERNSVWSIVRTNGIYSPIYVSLLPESTDVQEDQMYQVYGKLTKVAAMSYVYINQFSTSIDLEEV